MIVVSEIGEQWSPQTAPAIHAEIEIIIIVASLPSNTATTIGIRIPNVPHDVPVENARNKPIPNIIAGIKILVSQSPSASIKNGTAAAGARRHFIVYLVPFRWKYSNSVFFRPYKSLRCESRFGLNILALINEPRNDKLNVLDISIDNIWIICRIDILKFLSAPYVQQSRSYSPERLEYADLHNSMY